MTWRWALTVLALTAVGAALLRALVRARTENEQHWKHRRWLYEHDRSRTHGDRDR